MYWIARQKQEVGGFLCRWYRAVIYEASNNLYEKFNLLFGCQMSVMNFILGGRRGYSRGNIRCALKNPPSL